MIRRLRRHGMTIFGALVGATSGALYAHFVGCRTGSCGITSSVWRSALFFGLTGAVALWPSRPPEEESAAAPVNPPKP